MKKTSLFLSVLLLMGGQVWASDVVATVNGHRIYKKEIQTKGIMRQLKILHPEMNKKERKKLRLEMEVNNLAGHIRLVIAKEQRSRFNISATAEEGAAKWAEIARDINFEEVVVKRREELVPLQAALRAVYENGKDPDKVYTEQFSDKYTPEEWRALLAAHATPESRRFLDEQIKLDATQLKSPQPGIEYLVIQERMNAAIDAEISASDPDFVKYKQLIEQGTYNEAEAFKGPFYIETKRQEWWKDKYKKAKIEILDPKYKGALDLLYAS